MKNSHLKIVLWLLIPIGWIFGIYEWRVNSKLCDCEEVIKTKQQNVERHVVYPVYCYEEIGKGNDCMIQVMYTDSNTQFHNCDYFYGNYPEFRNAKKRSYSDNIKSLK